ncbi:MAG: glutathione S-transferase N-terminal domain-containing protein [Litorimonas sp.]
MKLYGSLTSPFVRKCRITALESGIDNRLDFVTTLVMDLAADQPNPLNLMPSLLTDEGDLIVDSRVICDYLQSFQSAPSFNDWADRTLVALADGLTDRAVSITLELRRPETERSPGALTRWADAIHATLPVLEKRAPNRFTPGAIALTCALGYLDFRHANLNWRAGHNALAAWYEAQTARPSVIATEPPA